MILVTGAAGHAGFPIVQQLSKAGAKTRAMVRDPAKAEKCRLPNVEIVAGDFSDPSSLENAMVGIERVMLITPPCSEVATMEAAAVAAAKKAGVKHIAKLSMVGADPNSSIRFARLHAQSEKNIENSKLAWTFLRPTFFMQNILSMAEMIKTGMIYMDAEDGKAPFVDLDDVAAVAVKTLTERKHEGKIYEITGPTALSYGSIAQILSRIFNKQVGYTRVPHQAVIESLTTAGMPPWQAEGVAELSENVSQGKFVRTTDVVRRIAGRPPKTFEKFIAENLAIFQ
jgi:uncharacterized protein YbjT (DUF2867 family)